MEKQKGLSLVETIIYVALLGLLMTTVVNLLLTVSSVYVRARVVRNASQQGIGAMERMTRAIQLAYRVDSSQSVLGSSPGDLRIDSIITPTNTATTSRRFLLSGDTLILEEGVTPAVALTNGIRVTNLTFYRIDTGASGPEAVRIEMTIQAGQGNLQTTHTLYGTAMMRGSY